MVDLDTQASLLSNLTDHLSPQQAEDCEGLLSLTEVYEALQGMALNKSPGLDGLPVEFYFTFWDLLGEDLVDVLNESFS